VGASTFRTITRAESACTASAAGGEQTGTRERTNKNGGAIAIGHPLGASGARIVTALVNALEQRGRRYGLQTMREGGGVANATIIERLA
jgi:acetyl-CoA acyltransferase